MGWFFCLFVCLFVCLFFLSKPVSRFATALAIRHNASGPSTFTGTAAFLFYPWKASEDTAFPKWPGWFSECLIFLGCFFKDFIYLLLRESTREGERGRETSMCKRYIVWLPLTHHLLRIWPTTQACALTGNQTSNPLVRRLALNPLSYTSQVLFSKPLGT